MISHKEHVIGNIGDVLFFLLPISFGKRQLAWLIFRITWQSHDVISNPKMNATPWDIVIASHGVPWNYTKLTLLTNVFMYVHEKRRIKKPDFSPHSSLNQSMKSIRRGIESFSLPFGNFAPRGSICDPYPYPVVTDSQGELEWVWERWNIWYLPGEYMSNSQAGRQRAYQLGGGRRLSPEKKKKKKNLPFNLFLRFEYP